MGIWDTLKSYFSKPKPSTYSVYIPSSSEQAKGTTTPKSYEQGFVGPIEKTSVSVGSMPGVSPTIYKSSGGGSISSSSGGDVSATPYGPTPPLEHTIVGGKTIVPAPTAQTLQPATSQALQPSVSAYDPDEEITPYGQTYRQAIWGGIGTMGRNIKQFFTGRTHEYKDPLSGFEIAGTLKKDLPTMTPYFGTAMEGRGAFQTYGELQKEIDVSRFSSGDVDRPDVPGLYERTGVGVQKFAPVVLDVGGYTIAGAVGGPLGIVGYGTFRGSQLAAKGQYKDVRSGMELYPGIAELSPESKAAGMHFGMAAYGGYRAIGGIGAEITALRIKEGMAARGVSMPRIISREGDDVFRVITRTGRRTPTFQADTKTTFDVFRVGDGRFQIGTGTGKTTMRVLDFMKEGTGAYPWRTATKSFTIAGRGGEAMLINAPEDIRAFTGSVLVAGDKGFTGVRFGGVSKPVGERGWFGVGGEVRAVRLYGAGRRTALISPKDLVFGKDISFVDVGGGKQWGWTGGGAKSSKQFFEQLYKPDAVLDISGQASTAAQKITSGVSVSAPRFSFAPSIIGMGEMRLLSKQRVATIQVEDVLSMGKQLERQRLRLFLGAESRSMLGQIQRPRQEFFTIPRLGQELGTKQIQRQRGAMSQFIPTIPTSGFRISPITSTPFKIPIIPWFPSGKLGTALGTRRISAKQLFRYTPSFAGYTWGIKAPQIPETPFGKFTGLEIRPIIPGGIKLKI